MQGITVGEAVRRARLQQKVARLDERYQADPDYGGAWISQKGKQFRAFFAFRGGQQRAIEDAEVAQVAEFLPAAHTLQEIQQERRRLGQLLKAHGIAASVSVRPELQRLELWPQDPTQVQALIENGTLELPPFVDVKNGPAVVRLEASVYGAGSMYGEDGSITYNCTGGFTVTDGSRRGMSTAGHCARHPGDLKTHRGLPVGQRIAYREYQDGLDVSWFINPDNTYYPRVEYGSSYYTITAVGPLTPPPGTLVCIIRHDGTQPCAYVERMFYYADATGPYDDGPYPVVDRYITAKKDSGGPWLYGGTAYGLHRGNVVFEGRTLSIFTSVGNLPRMGLNVVTQ